MAGEYIVVRQPKSLGISILLTGLFGPIGLFYVTVTGGLIMTLIPMFLTILFYVGLFGAAWELVSTSFLLLVAYAIIYWFVCIMWGAIAISSYNRELIANAMPLNTFSDNNQSYTPCYNNVHPIKTTALPLSSNESQNPTLQEWLKANPHKGINDYYSVYGSPFIDDNLRRIDNRY